MPSRKRTNKQRDADLPMIAEYYLDGKHPREIARLLSEQRPYDIGSRQIFRDLSLAFKRWQETAREKIDTVVGEELAKIDNLERKYWKVYEEFTAGGKVDSMEDGDDQMGFAALIEGITTSKRKKVTDNRQWAMEGIRWCIDRRIKLLGADSRDRTEIDVSVRITDVNAKIALLADATRARFGGQVIDVKGQEVDVEEEDEDDADD